MTTRSALARLSPPLAALLVLGGLSANLSSCNSKDGSDDDDEDTGLSGDDGSSGDADCSDELCIEVYDALYTIQDCDGAPEEVCVYANVFFLLTDGDANVMDLTVNELEMTLNDRDVGVEGAEALTQENGMLVDLLLDRSYSITSTAATASHRSYSITESGTRRRSNQPKAADTSGA